MQGAPSKRYQQLQPEDRVTLASLAQQKYSVRAMAQVLGRSPSTISRELRRNAQPVGELKRELIATLRHAHSKRVPRSKVQDRRGQFPDMVNIHLRPPEFEDRQFPGHWEGDLIK